MAEGLNDESFARASGLIPGGVNSPVRAFRAVHAEPVVAVRGEGPWLYDADGRRYVDHVMGWGAVMLGHAHAAVARAIAAAAGRGAVYGLSTPGEAGLAAIIHSAMPSLELLRLVNSGTEAAMSAVRLARAFTGRRKVLRFDGCYHGHADTLLDGPGVPCVLAGDTLTARYNDLPSVASLCELWAGDLACVIVEPVAGNMGVVPPVEGFLAGLRDLCTRAGTLLILDEVITGFRVAWGGAQALYGVRPDLTVLGKIIGGGLPVGAFGGRADVMALLAPDGPVYQAGTFAGNPVVAAAGIAALETLRKADPYGALDRAGAHVARSIAEAARDADVPVQVNRVGGMLTPFFTDAPVRDADGARSTDAAAYGAFFRAALERGVLLPPSPLEATFVSACHLEDGLWRKSAALLSKGFTRVLCGG